MTIQSVVRATDIISLFSSSQSTLGITQIATALQLNKATTWGLVTTLEQQGFLQQDPDTHKYSLGPKLFELGMVYIGSLEINAKASRAVHALSSRIGLEVRIGIWDRGSVLVTLLALPRAEDSFSHQIGPRVPAYCSGLGKALLAYLEPDQLQEYLDSTELIRHAPNTVTSPDQLTRELEAARERGYAVSLEEMIPGVAALGAPIFGATRKVVAAISIAGSPSALAEGERESVASELLRSAAEISREMGYYKFTG